VTHTVPIDLMDLSLFEDGAPHDVFAELRREAPVYWNERPQGGGFWALLRHADCKAVGRDPQSFSSAQRGNMIFDQFVDDAARPRMMIELDPPAHTRYRGLVKQGFTPAAMARLQPFARAKMDSILERALDAGECDFVSEIAGELPLQMIAELMGVPESLQPAVYQVANRIMAFSDPEFVAAGTAGENVGAMDELRAIARGLLAERRGHPGDDLSSRLARADGDAEALGDDEFELFFLLLVVAGIETTRSAIAGGMLAFHQFPEQWQRLREDPALLPSAIEEILRWTTPIHHFRRTATRDVDVGGTLIRTGDRVVMWYTSANRDETVFDRANEFDVGRSPNEHLGFGFGRHFCLGARLARLELEVAFTALLAQDVRIELVAPPRTMRSNFAQSPKSMPVRLRAGARRPG